MEIKAVEKIGNYTIHYDNEYGLAISPIDYKKLEVTAKDMFEKLGYEEDFHFTYIKYYNKKEDRYIWFYQETETIEIQFDITMDLLKAINKQIEELHWNE